MQKGDSESKRMICIFYRIYESLVQNGSRSFFSLSPLQNTLTLKSLSYFFLLPFVHKGEGSLHFRVLFHRNFGTKLATLCVYTQNNHVSAKKNDHIDVVHGNV